MGFKHVQIPWNLDIFYGINLDILGKHKHGRYPIVATLKENMMIRHQIWREMPYLQTKQHRLDILITYVGQFYQLSSVMKYPSVFLGEIQIVLVGGSRFQT